MSGCYGQTPMMYLKRTLSAETSFMHFRKMKPVLTSINKAPDWVWYSVKMHGPDGYN